MEKKIADDNIALHANKTEQLVLTGLLFSAALVLSLVENMLPPIIPVPGVKFGLPNIVVMYTLLFLDKGKAYAIVALKAVFVGVTRGIIAGFLSLCGGMLSISVMVLLLAVYKKRITYLMISICGAVSHNVGQYIAISVIYAGMNMLAYLPVLILSGVVAGIVTATLLKFIIPALKSTGIIKEACRRG